MENSVILSKYTKNDSPPTIPQGFCQCKSIRRCINNGNIEPCHEMGQWVIQWVMKWVNYSNLRFLQMRLRNNLVLAKFP